MLRLGEVMAEARSDLHEALVDFVRGFGHSQKDAEAHVAEALEGWKGKGQKLNSDDAVVSQTVRALSAFFHSWPIIFPPGGPQHGWPSGSGGPVSTNPGPGVPVGGKQGGGSAKPIMKD